MAPKAPKAPKRSRRSYLTALHEAGHATVALALGVRVGDVRVGRSADPAGGWLLGFCEIFAAPERRLTAGLIFAAGPGADRAANTRATALNHSGDLAYFRGCLGSDADWGAAVAVTSAMLGGPLCAQWLAIAHALHERDLTGDEVAAIFAACRI